MSVILGQISYLPSNELRAQRHEAARVQIDWFNKVLPNEKIIGVAQAYNESEYIDGVLYRKFDTPIGAGAARNVILNGFYNSDYDWLLLCDDDTVAYDYYDYQSFIKDVVNNPDKFDGIDAISALEPEYHPYKKLNYQDKNNLTHYKFEPRELNSGSATSLIRNIKKYHGKELYYPNIDASTGFGREDMEFLFAWLKSGLTWYTMDTWIRKSLCFDKSSIFGNNVKERDKILMQCLNNICVRYRADGLQRNINGQITWREFNDRYNKSFKVLYIKRETPIEYDINTTPKEKVYSKKLF